jgi:hypothetical protein
MAVRDRLERLRAMLAGPQADFRQVREEIHDAYKNATTDERVLLLEIYMAVLDTMERGIAVDKLDESRETRRQDYNLLLTSECVVGGGHISPKVIDAVTSREVAAGRMAPDDKLRELARASAAILPEPSSERSLRIDRGWRQVFGWMRGHK